MLALGITCNVLYAGLGVFFVILSGVTDEDDYVAYKILLFLGTVIAAGASCAGYWLSSVDGSIAGGGVFSALTCLLLITAAIGIEEWDGRTVICLFILAFCLFICAIVCFINISYFLGLGIACTVIIVISVIVTGVTVYSLKSEPSEIFAKVTGIILSVFAAGGLVAGYTVYDMRKDPVTAELSCVIYEYDTVTQSVGKPVEEGKLLINENYAVKLYVNLENLSSLSKDTASLRIEIQFPSEVVNYIAEGRTFIKNVPDSMSSSQKLPYWYSTYEVDAKSDKQFQSGYFIINYAPESLEDPVKNITARIYNASYPTAELMKSAQFEHKLLKQGYDFTEADFIKDLGSGKDGCFRITVPETCEQFSITVYDGTKSGIYCCSEEAVKAPYYNFNLYEYLQTNMAEEGYTEMIKQTRELVLTFVAVESKYNTAVAVDFKVTFKISSGGI